MGLRVALVTTNFLEPTHHAIRQLIGAVPEIQFRVFARRMSDLGAQEPANIASMDFFHRGLFSPQDLEGVDLVHLIYDGATSFRAAEIAAIACKPWVLSFHGGFDTNAKIKDIRYRDRTLELIAGATLTTVTSALDEARLRSAGAMGRIRVLKVPVNLAGLPKWVGGNSTEAIAVGRLIPKKGFDTALAALHHAPEFRLTLIGSGPEEGALREIVECGGLQDRVTFVGHRPYRETLERMARATCLLHPARVGSDGNAEGTPQIILIAQAMGLPVISTATGAIPEIISHGETGLLVSPNDPEGLARALVLLARTPSLARKISRMAAAGVSSTHGIPVVAQAFRALYGEAIQGPFSAPPPQSPEEGRALAVAAQFGAPTWAGIAGTGGQGTVWSVRMQTGGHLAIKFPADDGPDNEAKRRATLLKEGRALEILQPPWFPALIQVCPIGSYLVREMVIGDDLAKIQKHLPLEIRADLLKLLFRFARAAFQALHQRPEGPYLLKDLKPANLILPREEANRLVFCDLGSITTIRELQTRRTGTWRLGTGKWKHWPPEMLRGETENCGSEVDYFSLGTTAFELFFGQVPFVNQENDPVLAEASVSREFEISMNHLRLANIGAETVRFITACLEPDPARRAAAIHLWPMDDGAKINLERAYRV